jgi:hypothetical protein
MNKTDIIGVKNFIFINANIEGIWLLRAAPNMIRDVENKILFKKPNVLNATKNEMIVEYGPISFAANVYFELNRIQSQRNKP